MHLFRLATAAGPAKELRVFPPQGEIRRRHASYGRRPRARCGGPKSGLWPCARRAARLRGGLRAGVLLVVSDAIGGQRSVGDVVMAITLAAQVNQQVSAAVSLLHDLQRIARAFNRFEWLEAYVAEREPKTADQPVPERLVEGIRFENVAFRYPGTDRTVLEGVNLDLPAGSTVPSWATNGAGKSTLVKLLFRFYEPTAGHITADGSESVEDPASTPGHTRRDRPDFVRFEFVARRTVGVGDLPFGRSAAVEAALERAHARRGGPPGGWSVDASSASRTAEGTELSGGQCRSWPSAAMMRERLWSSSSTSPLPPWDAEGEHALFERYAEGARASVRPPRGVTVLVSHRFSTVRMAR